MHSEQENELHQGKHHEEGEDLTLKKVRLTPQYIEMIKRAREVGVTLPQMSHILGFKLNTIRKALSRERKPQDLPPRTRLRRTIMTPGMIQTLKELVENNPNLSGNELKRSFQLALPTGCPEVSLRTIQRTIKRNNMHPLSISTSISIDSNCSEE